MISVVSAKICGLSDEASLAAALAGGARRVGFIFFPRSPRYLEVERAAALAARVPEGVDRVGVMVDPGDDQLARLLAKVPLEMVQLHGSESPSRVADVKQRYAWRVIKAIPLATAADLAAAEAYERVADWLLFDAKAPPGAALPGGRGVAFDWRLLSDRRWRLPWLLSGGLDVDNVAHAVALTGTEHVDVCSGVEVRPGQKDAVKIGAFLAAVAALTRTKE